MPTTQATEVDLNKLSALFAEYGIGTHHDTVHGGQNLPLAKQDNDVAGVLPFPRAYLSCRVGSLYNTPFMQGRSGKYGWTCTEWIKAVGDIQRRVLSLGAPPLLIGLDSLHGTNYIVGSTIFPHVRTKRKKRRRISVATQRG